MKKTLLTLAAMATVAGAWAQRPTEAATPIPSDYIDVTPAYYKFYNGQADLESMIRADVQLPAAFNLGSNNWVSNNSNGKGENYFTAEQVYQGNLLMGAWIMNNNGKPQFKEGSSLYNFGGNVGSVLVINYQNSKLNEAIQGALNLESAPELPVIDKTVGGNINYFALLDFNAMNEYVLLANPGLTADDLLSQSEETQITPIRIRIRLVLNAYNNDMTGEKDALTFTYFQNEAGNTFGVTEPVDGSYVDLGQFVENGNWNPYGWMVRDYEFDYTGIAGAVKFQSTGIGADYNDGATLIRSIEAYILPNDAEPLPNIEGKKYSANYDSWLDLSPEAVTPLYLIGADVDGKSWELGTNPMAYENGLYTWSGEYLGNGFKINDGTWEDKFNIGAGEGALSLGTPYDVLISGESGNITFDGLSGVNNPTVVYDPVAMTVTVTGDGVEIEQGIPEALYIMGNISGNEWTIATAVPAVSANEGIFKFENIDLDADTSYFTFINTNEGDWSVINDGAHRYGPAEGQDQGLTVGDLEVKFALGGDVSFTIAKGVYDFVVDFNTMTFAVTAYNSGIDSIDSDNAPVEYYNLQGVKVANPQNGIYIIRKGSTTSKAVIR